MSTPRTIAQEAIDYFKDIPDDRMEKSEIDLIIVSKAIIEIIEILESAKLN